MPNEIVLFPLMVLTMLMFLLGPALLMASVERIARPPLSGTQPDTDLREEMRDA